MLVLGRKPGERILIGDNVEITIVDVRPNSVRIGIEAPRELPIVRDDAIQQSQPEERTPAAA